MNISRQKQSLSSFKTSLKQGLKDLDEYLAQQDSKKHGIAKNNKQQRNSYTYLESDTALQVPESSSFAPASPPQASEGKYISNDLFLAYTRVIQILDAQLQDEAIQFYITLEQFFHLFLQAQSDVDIQREHYRDQMRKSIAAEKEGREGIGLAGCFGCTIRAADQEGGDGYAPKPKNRPVDLETYNYENDGAMNNSKRVLPQFRN